MKPIVPCDFSIARKSHSIPWVRMLITGAILVALIGIPLLPVLAICGLAAAIANCVIELGSSVVWVVISIVYVIWLVLTGDWTQLGSLLGEVLDGIRSASGM